MNHPQDPFGNGHRLLGFHDQSGAMTYLQHLSAEPGNMLILRRALLHDLGRIDVSRLTDRQVIEIVSSSMRSGMLGLTSQALRPAPVGGMPAPVKEAVADRPADASETRERTSIRFQVVDDRTSRPIPGVPLTVTLPSGEEKAVRTNAVGLARIDGLASGTCTLRTRREGARLQSTYAYVEMGVKKAVAGTAGGTSLGETSSRPLLLNVSEHEVRTGDSIKSIADGYGLTWQELSEFNWDTSVPDEINEHLHDQVGCTAMTPDGFNYSFRTEDEPGILYIPKVLSLSGLQTDKTHTIRVKKPGAFLIILDSQEDIRLPDVEYRATLADGTERTGRLGPGGVSAIKDPPPGPVTIVFPDLDDVHAKSLAGAARRAFDERKTRAVFCLLDESPAMVKLAVAAYDDHFNDHSGSGFLKDLDLELIEEEPRLLASALLLRAGLVPLTDLEMLEAGDPDPVEEEYGYA